MPKSGRKGPRNRVFWIFVKMPFDFPEKHFKVKVLLIFYFPLQSLCLAQFMFWNYQSKCSWSIRLQDSWKCNISRKYWGIKLIFCLWINVRISYKVILLLMVGVARYSQSTKNKTFAISLQYFQKEVWNKYVFFAWR